MPLPVHNFLISEQVSRLQKVLRESGLPHVRERILIILLQNDGKTQQEIAKFLGCSPRTSETTTPQNPLEPDTKRQCSSTPQNPLEPDLNNASLY